MSEQRGSNHKLYIYEADSFAPLAQVQLNGKAGTGTDTDNSKPKQALALASQAPAAIKIELLDDDEGEWQPRKTAAAFAQQMRALQKQVQAKARGVQPPAQELPADFDDTLPPDFDDTLPPEEPDQPGSHKVVRLKDWRVRYYHNDHLGTPRELSDEDGSIVWSATYKAWGNTLRVETTKPQTLQNQELSAQAAQARQAQNDPNAQAQPIEQNLRFQGQYYDEETGLHYNRFRYYDPDVGRFVSQDPIGLDGGENIYQYAPNPIAWIDVLGLAKTCACGCPYVDQDKRWRELANDPKVPSHIRGWIKNQERLVALGRQREVKAPPGYNLSHRYGFENDLGYDYSHAEPALAADHLGIHHRYYRKRGGCWTVAMPKSGPRGAGKLSLPKPGALP